MHNHGAASADSYIFGCPRNEGCRHFRRRTGMNWGAVMLSKPQAMISQVI